MRGSMTDLACGMALVLAAALAPVAAADPLEDRIGTEQAQAMGLQKLSVEERAALARWIERQLDGQPVPANTPNVAFAIDGVGVQAIVVPAAPAAAVVTAPPPSALDRVPPPVTVGTAASFGLQQDDFDGVIKEIHAKVVGAFTGWDGETVFKLDNGQVWRQSRSGTYHYKATDPAVVIEKGFLGYKLRLVDTHRSVPVRRVR